jgi:hypothetical protein
VIASRSEVISAEDLPLEIRREVAALPLPPRVERRKCVADLLYQRLKSGDSFWEVVHKPYMAHDITRLDLREVVRRGLQETSGSYRVVTKIFNIEAGDYRRFLNFLRNQDCLLPFRDYR